MEDLEIKDAISTAYAFTHSVSSMLSAIEDKNPVLNIISRQCDETQEVLEKLIQAIGENSIEIGGHEG